VMTAAGLGIHRRDGGIPVFRSVRLNRSEAKEEHNPAVLKRYYFDVPTGPRSLYKHTL
jgi:hypothetical protein